MIPDLRTRFLEWFDTERYQALVRAINDDLHNSLIFRLCETPIFIPDDLARRLVAAAHDVITVIRQPGFRESSRGAIPPGLAVANETDHTHFLQADFAICRDADGSLTPQLIELQGFPSLYCFQHYLDGKVRDYYPIPDGMTPFFSGLDADRYLELLGRVLVGDGDPEQTVILEYQPYKQKTRIDFYLAERYFGVKSVCVTEVIQRGKRLFYRSGGREVPIARFYHRFIFDELIREGVSPSFDLRDEDVEVAWVGHPNWFFQISKHTMPLLDSPYAPDCHYLHELERFPDNLENYVLKPLYSFAGTGVEVDVTREMLERLEDRSHYLLQRKIAYEPVIRTLDEDAKIEVRMMFLWPDGGQPTLVNNLIRFSKGKMMGVDFNAQKTWVGSNIGFHGLSGDAAT